MAAHAELSPSSAARWMACPGSVALCRGLPDTSSRAADEGTAMHALAERCLTSGTRASVFIGAAEGEGGQAVTITASMADDVQRYVDYVRDLVACTGGTLLVEQRLDISGLTGEEDAGGTADAVILTDDELIVVDLKTGRREVLAERNHQLRIYALAAYDEHQLAADFKRVRLCIFQPRVSGPDEWTCSISDLEAFRAEVDSASTASRSEDAPRVPGEKQCQWCRAKATCPALAASVSEATGEPLGDLAFNLGKVALIEAWCDAVREEAYRRASAGEHVPGWKLVAGKRGARAWSDAEAAEEALKAMRVKHDQMYDYKVISPTSAEKLSKAGDIGPRQWPKLQALITQPDGKPSLVPETDKRPALAVAPAVDGFDVISNDPLA